MRNKQIVIGQRVDRALVERAKELWRRMTEEERILWQALRANQLLGLHFRRQQVIDRFIVDCYCHAAGLVVEVDGTGHKLQPGYDAERDRLLTARGLRVLRLTNDEVRTDLAAALARIAAAAREKT